MDISFPKSLYSAYAVKNAAIRFVDSFAVDIRDDDAATVCSLIFLSPKDDSEKKRLSNEFRVHVLDEDLRLRLKEQTEPLRNVILAQVFARTGLQGNE